MLHPYQKKMTDKNWRIVEFIIFLISHIFFLVCSQFFFIFTGRDTFLFLSKRGANSKLIKQLNAPEHDHVYITNERRSSRTCLVCQSPTKHQKFRRDNKLKSLNGALRCTNPHYPAHKSSTFNHDEVGGFNIAVS